MAQAEWLRNSVVTNIVNLFGPGYHVISVHEFNHAYGKGTEILLGVGGSTPYENYINIQVTTQERAR